MGELKQNHSRRAGRVHPEVTPEAPLATLPNHRPTTHCRGTVDEATDYWNHNTAHHPWLLDIAGRIHGDVLDVGCGEGLLAQRLAPVSTSVTTIDPNSDAVRRTRPRVAALPHVTLQHSIFDNFDARDQRYDLITFVASLHHMKLRSYLLKDRELLTPTGQIAVVGLSANRSIGDWLISAACLPAVRLESRRHRERRDIGVVVAPPRESMSDIRITAKEILPSARIRRGLYYRYLLHWPDPRF